MVQDVDSYEDAKSDTGIVMNELHGGASKNNQMSKDKFQINTK